MARTQAQARADLFAVQPSGWALPDDMDSYWGPMLSPYAAQAAGFEAAADAMLVEIDPGEAADLLPDYERVLGPDPFGRDQAPLSVAQRQVLARQRWTARGGASPAYFIGLAASLGQAITIIEFTPFKVGGGATGMAVQGEDANFLWEVNAPGVTVIPFRVGGGSVAGDNLLAVDDTSLIDAILALKPAHTDVLFNFTAPPQWDDAQWDAGAAWS